MSEVNEDLLYALAQIAITLTGLSGIVIALASPGSRMWGAFERVNMWYILGHGTAAFAAAITPPVLNTVDLAPDRLWQISFWIFTGIGLLLAVPALALVYKTSRNTDLFKKATATLIGSFIFYEGAIFAFAMNTPLILANFDSVIPRTQFVYAALVVFLILLALLHFAYFLAINSKNETEGST